MERKERNYRWVTGNLIQNAWNPRPVQELHFQIPFHNVKQQHVWKKERKWKKNSCCIKRLLQILFWWMNEKMSKRRIQIKDLQKPLACQLTLRKAWIRWKPRGIPFNDLPPDVCFTIFQWAVRSGWFRNPSLEETLAAMVSGSVSLKNWNNNRPKRRMDSCVILLILAAFHMFREANHRLPDTGEGNEKEVSLAGPFC